MLPRQKAKLICFFLSVLLITLTLVGTSHLRALLGNLAVTREIGRASCRERV